MENVSKGTMAFPLVLRYLGMKEIHTLQKTSMLNVITFASLKLSGSCLARKAIVKLRRARKPSNPDTVEGSSGPLVTLQDD